MLDALSEKRPTGLYDSSRDQLIIAEGFRDIAEHKYLRYYQEALTELKNAYVASHGGRMPDENALSDLALEAQADPFVAGQKLVLFQSILDLQNIRAGRRLIPYENKAPQPKPVTEETQQSVGQWVSRTFSNTRKDRVLSILEEAMELALNAGLSYEEIVRAVLVPVKKAWERDPEDNVPEEAADVLLGLYALAVTDEFDLHAELNRKMRLNRSRPQSYYDAKQAAKRAHGMPSGA